MTVNKGYDLPCLLSHHFSLVYVYNSIVYDQVLELGELIKTKQITSEELSRIFLQRLKR